MCVLGDTAESLHLEGVKFSVYLNKRQKREEAYRSLQNLTERDARNWNELFDGELGGLLF